MSWSGGSVEADETFSVRRRAPDDDRRGALPGHPADHGGRGRLDRRGGGRGPRRAPGAAAHPDRRSRTPRPPRRGRPPPRRRAATTTTADLPGTTLEAANEGDGDVGGAVADRRGHRRAASPSSIGGTAPQAPGRCGRGRRGAERGAPSGDDRRRADRDAGFRRRRWWWRRSRRSAAGEAGPVLSRRRARPWTSQSSWRRASSTVCALARAPSLPSDRTNVVSGFTWPPSRRGVTATTRRVSSVSRADERCLIGADRRRVRPSDGSVGWRMPATRTVRTVAEVMSSPAILFGVGALKSEQPPSASGELGSQHGARAAVETETVHVEHVEIRGLGRTAGREVDLVRREQRDRVAAQRGLREPLRRDGARRRRPECRGPECVAASCRRRLRAGRRRRERRNRARGGRPPCARVLGADVRRRTRRACRWA